MWTPEQQTELAERGLTRLRGAVDAGALAELCARIWELVGERGTTPGGGTRVLSATVKSLKESGEFDLIHSPAVRAAADALLGPGGWFASRAAMGLLMTLPGTEPWTVPHRVWHLDHPCPGGVEGLPGIQVFLLLDRVEPRGGGTLAVAGSHRLVAEIQQSRGEEFAGRSAEVRKLLDARVPWLRALWSLRADEDREARFMREAAVFEGVPLQVVEMTGERGDVVFTHPWLVHTIANNTSEGARIVLTDRLLAHAHPHSAAHRYREERRVARENVAAG